MLFAGCCVRFALRCALLGVRCACFVVVVCMFVLGVFIVAAVALRLLRVVCCV